MEDNKQEKLGDFERAVSTNERWPPNPPKNDLDTAEVNFLTSAEKCNWSALQIREQGGGPAARLNALLKCP